MTANDSSSRPRITERLRGRRLLVTGSTGLLAKVFVEKLLRSVPDIGCIHLLVRPRHDGTSSGDRLKKEVLGSSVFGRLRAALGPRFDALCEEKIRLVSGDLTKERLGLSVTEYASLAEQIDIIVNSAAAVTFDERLDLALTLNTQGPLRLLQLARDCGDAPFMQVSTCYVSGTRTGDIPEELNPPADGRSINLDAVIQLMQEKSDAILAEAQHDDEARRKKLIATGMELARQHGWNDTYTFTKWLGEQLVNRERGNVPLVILRPAIIEGAFEEPLPGWIDGLRMADPMIIAFGRGKLAEFPADPSVTIDLIPVDLVSNAMVAALPLPGDGPGLRIYQVGSSARNALRVGQLIGYLEEAFRRRPMIDDAGNEIPAGQFKLVSRDEFFPKWERELARAQGWKQRLKSSLGKNASAARRRALALTIAQIEQLIYFAKIYSPYTHLNCRFRDDKLRALADLLHPADRAEFSFATERVEWADYVINRHVAGLRKFVLGSAEGLPRPVAPPSGDDHRDGEIRAVRDKAETIFGAFDGVVAIAPNQPALQMNRGGVWIRYTYAEAEAATGTIARRFTEFGVKPGDRVVICGENCPEWGLTYVAAMRAGLTAVPLDPQLPAAEIMACARFAEARLICAGRTTLDAIKAACAGALPIMPMAEPFVPGPGVSLDAPPPRPAVRGDQMASILFTSGTTVSPKAVPLTHANFLADVRSMQAVHPLGLSDRYCSVLPLYHAFEFTCGFLVPVTSGGTITYVEQLKGPDVIAAMQATGTTVMLVVPRLLKLFYDAIQRKVQAASLPARAAFRVLARLSDLSGHRWGRALFGQVQRQFGGRLKMFVSGGSALDPELFTAFARMGLFVCEGYGLTETAPVLTVSPPGAGRSGSAGKALPGVDIQIHNANSEGIGELCVRGPNVMSGYLNNPAATAEILSDGWLRTGDLGRRDADGYFSITGRVKDMIVTDNGKNVYPDEVQVRYKDLPYVKEICVLGMPNVGGIGESVHAVIVPDLENARELDPSSVERIIRESAAEIGAAIPSHQRIHTLHFWDKELPKTSTLKAKRGLIRDILLNGGRSAAPAAGPRTIAVADVVGKLTPAQVIVRDLVAKLTRKPEAAIHPESNLLLDLGVDSLMKLQIVAELEAHFDMTFPDETASAVARVSDLYALIGDRSPGRGKGKAGDSWRKRLHGQPQPVPIGAEAAHLNGQSPASLPARWLARGGVGLFFKSYVRVRASGLGHVPAGGPFILAANHTSHLDSGSVLTALGGRRRVWVAGAQDYFFNTPTKSWVFGRLFDTIPFDRHAEGFEGLRRCIETLDRGDGVLFFPEGTRSLTGKLQPFKIGVAVMSVDGRAPVVPVHVANAYELFRKGQRLVRPGVVRVTFGAPIAPGPWTCADAMDEQYRLYREMTRHIEACVAALARGAEVGRMTQAAAFFDVDGTLVSTHIVHQYIFIRRRMLPLLLRPLWTGAFYTKAPYYLVLDKISRSRLNVVFYRNYAGLRGDEVRGCVDACFEQVIRPHLYGQARGCIDEHRAAGRRIVLVTGSIDFIIAPLAQQLGADDVIARKLVEREGRFTGELDGPPVGEEEKARQIRAYSEREAINLAASFAYGDSIADLPMLETVGRPQTVNPDRPLAQTAQGKGWPIHRWTLTNGRWRE